MTITLDTKTRTVDERPDAEDKELSTIEMENRVANLLAVALMGTAMRFYKKNKTREMFIQMVAMDAINKLDGCKTTHYDEDGNVISTTQSFRIEP